MRSSLATLLLSLTLIACGDGSPSGSDGSLGDAQNGCAGCWSQTAEPHECLAGDTDNACGVGGATCQICVAGVSTCMAGACRSLCQPSDLCAGEHETCLEGVCQLPWGRTVTLSALSAKLPLVHSSYDDETGTTPDPFLIVYVDGAEIGRTEVLTDNEEPSFSETFSFALAEETELEIVVWDDDTNADGGRENDMIGGVSFPTGLRLMETAGNFGEYDQPAGSLSNLHFIITFQ